MTQKRVSTDYLMKSLMLLILCVLTVCVCKLNAQIISALLNNVYFAAPHIYSVEVLFSLWEVVLSLSLKTGRGLLYTVCVGKD